MEPDRSKAISVLVQALATAPGKPSFTKMIKATPMTVSGAPMSAAFSSRKGKKAMHA